MYMYKYESSRGCLDISGEEEEGSVREYLKKMDKEEMDCWLNWMVGGGGKEVEFDEDKVEGDVVILNGEECIYILSDEGGDEFKRVIGELMFGDGFNWVESKFNIDKWCLDEMMRR